MSRSNLNDNSSLLSHSGQPLIGILVEENGEEMIRYFSEEQDADAAAAQMGEQDALSLAGAWKDLDWDEMQGELGRIRHENPPSPPLDL